jgi:uncharacterized cupredoxin-like copper-binding protein
MTPNAFRFSRLRALAALVFALGLTAVGATAVSASAPGAQPAKKAVKVNVVVNDTHDDQMTDEEEHAPGSMSMGVLPESVKHGKVKFIVKNTGSEVHEFVILKTNTAFDALPVSDKDRVNEASSVGEIGHIAAGKTKSKTFKLKAGDYVLVCNIAEHYGAGMRAAFTVT